MPIARAAVSRAVVKNVIVTPPAPSAQFVAAGESISAKTFSRFKDPERVIRKLSASIKSSGSATLSGNGLGPYSISGAVNGERGAISLRALDADNNVVATAIHVWGIATTGDYSPWKLLSTADIAATTDTGNLETSKSMSGDEIQFRGSVPAGSSDYHPDNGCLYQFGMIDPNDGTTFSAGNGDIIGIQFYFKLGSTVPNSNREFVYCGIWDGSQGSFGGALFLSADRIAYGSYTSVTQQSYSRSAGNAYLVEVMMADDSSDSSGVAGLPSVKVFDDSSTPARAASNVSGNQTTTISATTAKPTLSFSGDRRNNRNHRRNNPNKKFSIGKKTSHVTTYAKDNEHPERTIRRFLKKCKKERVVERSREYDYYEKPSVKRARAKARRKALIEKANRENQSK
jgi:ribosomal protein S21